MSQADNLAALATNVNSSGVLQPASGGTGATAFPSPGTAGNVLTSNGSAWTSAAAAAFDAGTRLIFAQTSAPTGWTKDTTNYNNHALRVVTGAASTGGSVDFTTAFASQTPSGSVTITSVSGTAGATTLTSSQLPSHTHGVTGTAGGPNGNPGPPLYLNNSEYVSPPIVTGFTTNATNVGGGSHDHPFSFSSGSGSFSGNAINLAVKYVDVIRATKN